MKLTKTQIKQLEDNEWDVVNNGDAGNAKVLSIYPEDKIFGEVCELYGLTGDEEYDGIHLAVVATKEK